MAASTAWSSCVIVELSESIASSHSFCPGHLSLMAMSRLRMASVTALVWEASSCHIGGSLGFTTRDLAAPSRLELDLIRLLPA